ncbi:MAG: TIGR02996 domain-containing protein, partial [Fimbriiglobus sp.]
MHPDERALTAAVVAAPDDDLPRLVLADWLDEHDEPGRAEFIRAQCQLAATEPADPFAATCRHVRPEWGTGDPWRHTLPAVDGTLLEWLPGGAFRRGFGWALRVRDLAALTAAGDRLFAETPIGELHLPTATPVEWRRFFAARWLPRVRAVHFFGTVTPIEPLTMLCDSPAAAGLERLSFGWAGSPAMPELVDRLFRAPLGRRVRELVFRSANVDGHFLEALGSAPAAAALDSLRFEVARFDPDAAADFPGLPLLYRLASLEIDSSPVSLEWLRVLASAPGLAGLARLGLRRVDLTPVAARALTEGFWRPDLRALDLGKNGGGGRAAV